MKIKSFLALIFFVILFIFLPIFLNPFYLTHKDNDLGRTYVPIFEFYKDSIVTYHQIPLWRPGQLMGETFVGNPISSLFYPFNTIFVFLPVHIGVIIYYFIHILIAAISTFFLAKSFSFNSKAAFAASLFYSLSTTMLVHIEAGHITMVAAFSLFPFSLLALRKILTNYQFKWLVVLASSLSLIYMAYPTIFYYSVIFITFYWIYSILKTKSFHKKSFLINILYYFSALIIAACLSAIILLPHLEFAPLSTRSSLALKDVALPLWNLKKIFLSLTFPYLDKRLTHEEFLYIGIIPSVLSLIGFLKLNKLRKVVLSFGLFFTILFVLGLSTPFFEASYNFLPFLKYSRITTRLWFVAVLITALLSAYAINKIKNQKLAVIIITFFLAENIFIFTTRNKNIPYLNFQNEEIYQYLSKDHELFRIYCTAYCFNPQLISKYRIQVLHGESPIQQKDFIKFLEKAGNYNWNDFAVIFPPYQIWQTNLPPNPNAKLLGDANVKYVASTYSLNIPELDLVQKFDKIFLYRNKLFKQRFRFDDNQQLNVTAYSPNEINIKFEKLDKPKSLLISENYYNGWVAAVINSRFVVNRQKPVFKKVALPKGSEDVWLKFQPKSYIIGRTISIGMIVFLLLALLKFRNKQL